MWNSLYLCQSTVVGQEKAQLEQILLTMAKKPASTVILITTVLSLLWHVKMSPMKNPIEYSGIAHNQSPLSEISTRCSQCDGGLTVASFSFKCLDSSSMRVELNARTKKRPHVFIVKKCLPGDGVAPSSCEIMSAAIKWSHCKSCASKVSQVSLDGL